MMDIGDETPAVALSRSTVGTDSKSVNLSFYQSVEKRPEAMYLMYAIGMSPQISMHKTRSCFEILEFPTCPSTTTGSGDGDSSTEFVAPPVAPEDLFIAESS